MSTPDPTVDNSCGVLRIKGRVGAMSFDDLPEGWTSRPLTDEGLAADVLDLVVRDGDRPGGGLAVLLCRPDRTMAQPIFVEGQESDEGFGEGLWRLLSAVAEHDERLAVVLGMVRAGHSRPTDADRARHQICLDVCGSTGVALLSTHVVTPEGITPLPSGPAAGHAVA